MKPVSSSAENAPASAKRAPAYITPAFRGIAHWGPVIVLGGVCGAVVLLISFVENLSAIFHLKDQSDQWIVIVTLAVTLAQVILLLRFTTRLTRYVLAIWKLPAEGGSVEQVEVILERQTGMWRSLALLAGCFACVKLAFLPMRISHAHEQAADTQHRKEMLRKERERYEEKVRRQLEEP